MKLRYLALTALLLVVAIPGGALAILGLGSIQPPWMKYDHWQHFAGGGMFGTDSPAFSPDGQSIAFSSPATGHGDIYVLDLATSKVDRVTTSRDCDLSPRFSGPPRVIFERESPRYCHLWLVDLDTHAERQLTNGKVRDNLLDVSPDGDYVIMSRADFWSGGIYLLKLRTGETRELPVYGYAMFINNGTNIVGNMDEKAEAVAMVPLEGTPKKKLCTGYLMDCNDNAKTLLIGGSLPTASPPTPNVDIQCFPLTEPKPFHVGTGRSARVFMNGKVLFFVGFEDKAWIWDPADKTARQIESPPGHKYVPNRSSKGNQAALFVLPPETKSSPTRDVDIYLFDANTETFTKITPSPPLKQHPESAESRQVQSLNATP